MASVGPEIPAHLLAQRSNQDEDDHDENDDQDVAGPQLPPHLRTQAKPMNEVNEEEDDDDDDDYGPALPPHLAANRVAGPSKPPTAEEPTNKRVQGPSFPTYAPTYNPDAHDLLQDDDDDDDDDFGPKPLPSGMKHVEKSAVEEFMEREERRRKEAEGGSKKKELKREEWMLKPPTSSELLGGLDPSKLTKARQFSRSAAPAAGKNDSSLWTETPQERQQRLADEVAGKKRPAAQAATEPEDDDKKRRRLEEAAMKKGVEEYTKKVRGPSLMDRHTASGKGEEEAKKDKAIWDHSRDMGIGGRLMDDSKRNQLVRESKGLSSRFGSGTSGGFL